MFRRLALLLPLLPLLAACAAASWDGTHIDNSRWRFVAIDGAGPASDKTRLDFAGERLSINVGCNGMGGPWRIENGRLIAGPLIQTEMYCDGPVWDQERAVAALFAGTPAFAVEDDRMTLKSSGHSAELQREAAPPR